MDEDGLAGDQVEVPVRIGKLLASSLNHGGLGGQPIGINKARLPDPGCLWVNASDVRNRWERAGKYPGPMPQPASHIQDGSRRSKAQAFDEQAEKVLVPPVVALRVEEGR